MSNVPVVINGRTYDLTCNDGQENLQDLASGDGGAW
jgi:cell division protein ZapA (FtsZ GTPase activity inhibitor)